MRMKKSFHDRCTPTTVVRSPEEFKGSPAAMLGSSLEMIGGMARRAPFWMQSRSWVALRDEMGER